MVVGPEDISPFTLAVPDHVLSDLKKRLELTRFPQSLDLPASEEWSYGVPTPRMEDIVAYWKDTFDWRKVEANINAKLPQFTTSIDAEDSHGTLKVHFVHMRSSNPNATPLLFCHGWPGNFLEVSKIIEPLVNPVDPKDPAFHVVAPSLPGYVFSEASKSPGLGVKRTALIFDKLMKRLGYNYYVGQGGDWGSLIVKALAAQYGESCRAIHTNMPVIPAPTFIKNPIRFSRLILGFMGLPGGYSKREVGYIKEMEHVLKEEMGYMKLQATKPQTLAFGLTDSPAALLAWIYEKLHRWTDEYPWTNDEILTWVMLYWISVAGPVGSVRYYKETPFGGTEGKEIVCASSNTPLGVSVFPGELMKFPDDWQNMMQPVVYCKSHDVGGHFAAYEQPELLVEDIRRFTEIVLLKDKRLLPK